MSLINENFLKLQDSYLFSTIAKKVAKFTEENPEILYSILFLMFLRSNSMYTFLSVRPFRWLIKLGIGDVTRPIVPACIEAMHKAVDEIGTKSLPDIMFVSKYTG